MEPSTLISNSKPRKYWFFITLAGGALGALAAIGAAGKGTYDIAPFKVQLRAFPAIQGATEFTVDPVALEKLHAPKQFQGAWHAEAGTHKAPMRFRATITDLISPASPDDIVGLVGNRPGDVSSFLAANAKGAMRSFGLKLLGLAIGGGAAAGLALSLGRWRRIAGGAVAGLLTFAIIGLLVQQTYNSSEFSKTKFMTDKGGRSVVIPKQIVLPLSS